MKNLVLTEREKAAIRLAIYYPNKIPKQELYRIAYRGRYEDTEQISDVPAVASRWWDSKKVQGFYQTEKAAYDSLRQAERASIQADCEARLRATQSGTGDDDAAGGIIDYSRPENIRRKLNQIINTAADSGEALDAIKLLLARQSEIAPEHRPEGRQVRAYLPLQCYQCPLYVKEKENL